MPQRSDVTARFFTHGVDVDEEEPEKVASLSRRGRGTLVRQREGENWFHFALPAETIYEEDEERFP